VKSNNELTEAMLSLGANVTYGVYQKMINLICEEVRANQPVHGVREKTFTVDEMDDYGKSKVDVLN